MPMEPQGASRIKAKNPPTRAAAAPGLDSTDPPSPSCAVAAAIGYMPPTPKPKTRRHAQSTAKNGSAAPDTSVADARAPATTNVSVAIMPRRRPIRSPTQPITTMPTIAPANATPSRACLAHAGSAILASPPGRVGVVRHSTAIARQERLYCTETLPTAPMSKALLGGSRRAAVGAATGRLGTLAASPIEMQVEKGCTSSTSTVQRCSTNRYRIVQCDTGHATAGRPRKQKNQRDSGARHRRINT